MDYSSSITADAFLKLKCHLCANHLSHFPVFMSSNKHNVCGRCWGCLNHETSARNEVYEALAQFVEFPCRYKPDGCPAHMLPKDVPEHEQKCEFQRCKCPVQEYAKCTWEGPRPSRLYHCQEKHGELFLKNGTFQFDLSRSYKKESWLQCNSRIFVVKQNFFSINKLLELSICKVGDGVDADDFSCVVNFSTTNMNLSVKCHEAVFVKEQPVEIFLDSLTERNSQSLVTGRINLDKSAKDVPIVEKVDHEFVALLKCVTCLEYVLPPIYYQETTNILGETATRCNDCMSAKPIIKGKPYTRNVILDQMANLLNYPCKNTKNGCSFVAKPPEMKRHLESCPYGKQECPLNGHIPCPWTGMIRDLNGHFLDAHSHLILSSEPVSENLPNSDSLAKIQEFHKCYIIKFLDLLFYVDFEALATRYKWVVQMIGPFEPGFMFEVEIVDSNNKNSLVARQPCVPFSRTKIPDAGVYFNLDQIVHLRKCSQTIAFRVKVFK